MREIRTSGSMSGDGKRDQYACGVQSTRARPRLYPRLAVDEAKGPAATARGNSLCTSPSVQYVGKRARFIAPLHP